MGILDGKLGGLEKVVTAFGATVYLRRFSNVYSPATRKNTQTDVSGSPHETKAVWGGYLQGSARYDLDGRGVGKPGDRELILNDNGLPFEPQPGDYVEFPDRNTPSNPRIRYTVLNVDPLPTGDEIPFWQIQVRAG